MKLYDRKGQILGTIEGNKAYNRQGQIVATYDESVDKTYNRQGQIEGSGDLRAMMLDE